MTVIHHSKDDDGHHHHHSQQHQQEHEEARDLEIGEAQDHVPLASAVLIDEGLIEAEVFHDEVIPPSSPPPRSYSSSSSSSLHGSASIIYDAVTTCPVIEEGGPSSNTQRNTTPPLLHHLGRRAQTIDCPVCREEMMTTVATSRIGGFAIIMSLLVLLMASPFFWIPLVIPMCRVTKHYCSKCHQQVGETHPCG